MRFGVLTILFAMAISASADPKCNPERIQDIDVVDHMPPTRYQENSLLCFSMSTMQLLNHYQCVTRQLCQDGYGFDPGPDELSVRDGLALYYKDRSEDSWGKGGQPDRFLDAIAKAGKLAPESCAPFDQLAILSMDNASEKDIFDFLHELYVDYHASHQSADCFVAARFPNLESQGLQLKKFVVDVQAALDRQSYREYISAVTLPPRCEAERRSLPNFHVGRFNSPEEKALRDKIEGLLGRHIPVSFSHNAYTRFPEGRPADDFISAHAANIAGKRTRCCGPTCETQYLILDSGLVKGQEWESSAVVIRSIQDISELDAFAAGKTDAVPAILKQAFKFYNHPLANYSLEQVRDVAKKVTSPGTNVLTWIEP